MGAARGCNGTENRYIAASVVRPRGDMRRLGGFRPAVLQVAPIVAAVLTLACGAMLLVSGATPSDPGRFEWLMGWAPPLLVELSHFLSSVLGLALVLTAFGLNRRRRRRSPGSRPRLRPGGG